MAKRRAGMVKKISVMHFIPLLISKIRVRSGRDDEAISIRTVAPASAPEWLRKSWDSAKRLECDQSSFQVGVLPVG